MEKSVFNITAPPEISTEPNVLLVPRGMGMMGTSYVAFYVKCVLGDTFDGDDVAMFSGYDTAGNIVVSFPAGTPFLMVPRSQLRMLTAVENIELHKADQAAIDEALKDTEGETKSDIKLYTGQYN